jgi:hypothetical protein
MIHGFGKDWDIIGSTIDRFGLRIDRDLFGYNGAGGLFVLGILGHRTFNLRW